MRELGLSEIAEMSRSEAEEAIRSRVRTVYVGNNRVLTRILGRQKLFLSTLDLGFACHVMLDGYWEIWLTQFFARLIKPGMTVVDVGANAGYYSLLFGDAVGSDGKVIAVEPLPDNVDILRRSIELNGHSGKTQLHQVALGDQAAGTVNLYVPPGEPKNATLVSTPVDGSIAVEMTTLDHLTEKLAAVDFIKIDAEGAEEAILNGMTETIRRHSPRVVLEFNAARSKDASQFLAVLRDQFGTVSAIDFFGKLYRVSDHDLLHKNLGEDWLLYLEPRA